tara:strand:+ start:5097 stop:5363 length:267 start_codon:yes stop_codon:yes gene_type:complete
MSIEFQYMVESLIKLGGKKADKGIHFLKPNLLIKHKKAGIKYTVVKIIIDDTESPHVICYRYFKPNKKIQKKVFIKINKEDFDQYEPV